MRRFLLDHTADANAPAPMAECGGNSPEQKTPPPHETQAQPPAPHPPKPSPLRLQRRQQRRRHRRRRHRLYTPPRNPITPPLPHNSRPFGCISGYTPPGPLQTLESQGPNPDPKAQGPPPIHFFFIFCPFSPLSPEMPNPFPVQFSPDLGEGGKPHDHRPQLTCTPGSPSQDPRHAHRAAPPSPARQPRPSHCNELPRAPARNARARATPSSPIPAPLTPAPCAYHSPQQPPAPSPASTPRDGANSR
jgi:hypothetical protein